MAMQTQAERLASFKVAHPTTKKRTSSAKGAKTLHWPHEKPDVATVKEPKKLANMDADRLQLAKAGFYFKPTPECPDNASCFLCGVDIEGWESDDDPFVEHLNLAPNCGWAINMCIEEKVEAAGLDLEENPMSSRMYEARIATFDSRWPLEEKKGWKCQAHKMAEAGWFFCPTEESDDYVKCPYCSLALDGWERKDNPYDAHQSRAPDCKVFEQPAPKAKSGRGRKGRTSKVPRMSTQSNLASAMEGVSIADPGDTRDESVMIQENNSVMHSGLGRWAKKAPKTKRSNAKPQGKATKNGAEESMQASSVLEPEDDDFEVKVMTMTTKAPRGRKRKSEEIHDSLSTNVHDAEELPRETPAKRRATRTRANTIEMESTQVARDHAQDADLPMTDNENMLPPAVPVSKRAVKGGRKKGSSIVRKASTTSTASMASLRATVPNDEEIDAALEADLDRPLTDEEDNEEPLPTQTSRSRRLTRTKPTSRNATASIAPTRRMTRTSALPSNITHEFETHNEQETRVQIDLEQDSQPVRRKGANSRKVSKKHADTDMAKASSVEELQAHVGETGADVTQATKSNPKRTRQTSRQVGAQKPPASDDSIAPAIEYANLDINSSALGSRTAEDDSGHETDASVANQVPRKRGPKKGGRKPKAAKKTGMMSRNIEDIVQQKTDPIAEPEMPDEQTHVDAMVVDEPDPVEVIMSEEVAPPTKATRKKNTKFTKSKTAKAKPVIEEPLSPVPMTDEPWADQILGESTPIPSAAPKLPTPSPARTVRTATPAVASEVIEASPKAPSAQQTPRAAISSQSSDAENRPPSSRPSALRPPLEMPSPSKAQTIHIPLAASTPTSSPSKRNISKLQTSMPWTAIDFEKFFAASPNADKENVADALLRGALTSPEKKLTVEEWIYQNARKGEEKLGSECERLVGRFEGEGVRALKSLEGIRCAEQM